MAEPSTSQVPWPTAERDVVFLADTHHRVERSIIHDWLKRNDPRGTGAPVGVVHIGRDHGQRSQRSQRLDTALGAVLDRDGSTLLVPLRVAWLPERDPQSSAPRIRDLVIGDPRHPKKQIAKAIHRWRPDGYECIAGAPATLEELRRQHERGATFEVEDLADHVLRHAEIALDVRERTLQGRRYKVPRFVTEGIETSAAYTAALEEFSTTLSRPLDEVRQESRDHLRELVATPSTFFIDWMGTLTRWITSLGYARVVVDPEQLERARAAVSDHPTALLWTHKSHMDGIALLSVLYDHDFPAPHSLGGRNMAMGPLGQVGQRSGIIYIRRTFSDSPVYKMALQQYLGFLMSKRFPLSWAFEGTRSRNGKLGRPRYGLLKYVIDAAHATETEDLHLIPVSISYDLIGETTDYAREESGQAKQAESLGWFMGYLKRLRAPMGNIYLDFAEPVVLEGPAPRADRELLAQVAFEVARRANGMVPVTLPSLLCTTLLGVAPRALTYDELHQSMSELLAWLRARGIRLAESFDHPDDTQLELIAEHTFAGGVVQRLTDGAETLFGIPDDQYPAASYYRNTIIHYFVNKALCEVALELVADHDPDTREDAFWEELRWLRDATKFEFFHTPSADFAAEIDAEMAQYGDAWPAVLRAPADEVRAFLADLRPLVSPALLPFIEGYWLVARAVAEHAPEDTPSESTVVSRAMRLGHSSVKQQELSSQASIGKAVFAGAYSFLGSHDLVQGGAPALAEDREAMVARLQSVIASILRIREGARADLVSPSTSA